MLKFNSKKFVADTSALLAIATTRTTVPAQECVLVSAFGKTISVSASNNHSATLSHFNELQTVEAVESFAAPAKQFYDILRGFGDAVVTITVMPQAIEVKSGSAKITIPTQPVELFPSFSPPKTEGAALDGDAFKAAVSLAIPFADKEDYETQFTLLWVDPKAIAACDHAAMGVFDMEDTATDGYTMSLTSAKLVVNILPNSMCKTQDDNKWVWFTWEGGVLGVSKSELKAPDFNPIKDAVLQMKYGSVSKSAMLSALSRARITTMIDFAEVAVELTNNKINLNATSDFGNYKETVNCTGDHVDEVMCFNIKRLILVLSGHQEENLDVYISKSAIGFRSPGRFTCLQRQAKK